MSGDWAPGGWGGFGQASGNGYKPEAFKWERLDKIKPRPLVFVQKPFLQAASFHLFVGIKNAGKGTWLTHWAAQMTRGELGERRSVMWVAIGEDSYGMDIRPRFEAAGGDLERAVGLTRGQLLLPDGTDDLHKMAKKIGDVGLIVIDPLGGSLSGDKDTNSDKDVRPALAALNQLADRTGAIVIGVRHLSIKNEKRQGGTLSAVLGSTDWINIPRAVLALMHDDTDSACRHLFLMTGNRVRDDTPGLLFRIEGVKPPGWDEEVTVVRELGESGKDPDELLVIKRKRKVTKTAAARQLIGELLAGCEGYQMESDVVDAEIAKLTGATARTVKYARNEMKDAGLVKAIPEKDEHGTVLRWYVALTVAGANEFVTNEVPEDKTLSSGGSGSQNATIHPKRPPVLYSGDLQGLSEEGDPEYKSAGVLGPLLDNGQSQSPDIVTLSDLTGDATTGNGQTPYEWVQTDGWRLTDDELADALEARFNVSDEDVGALMGLADSLRG